jgi:two-component system, OmpR family, sensor histidine kinase BaeS
MRDRFALRLAAAFAAIGIAAAALTAVLVNIAFDARFAGYLEEQQERRIEHLATSLAEAHDRANGWQPAELDRVAAVALMDGGTVRLSDLDGAVVWEGEGGPMARMHRQMMGTGPLGPERDVTITADGEVVGTAAVALPQAGLLPSDVAFRSAINRALLLAGGLAGAIAIGVGLVLARRATAPARELTDAARAFAAGDRGRRVQLDRSDEFGQMAAAFDRMAETVEEEDRLRRTFAADVAHELRTPLMILRGEIEALEDGIVAASPQALASLREETIRLGRLVDDLETLARADAAGFTLEHRPVVLADVVAEAVAGYAPALETRAVTIDVRADTDARLLGDHSRLVQVVTNLLGNAAAHTPDGGRIEVTVTSQPDAVVLEVADTGTGIPPDELPHVFERFFRGRGALPGGSGIGLTVVHDLVDAHGGEVTANNDAAGGARFTVRLPLVAEGSGSPWSAAERVARP